MRVLLTGAFGNVGQNVLNLLLELGHSITCFDIKNKKNERTFEDYDKEDWVSRKIKAFWGDIRKKDDVNGAIKDIDTVIHLAAIVGGIGANRENPGKFFYDNLMMGVQLMEIGRQVGVEKFIALGTIGFVGGMEQPPREANA